MPAWRLTDQPSTVDPFDVLGQSEGTSDLMVHALLCNETDARSDVTLDAVIRCVHMGPPLGLRREKCDAIGSAGLGDTQRRKVKTFADDRLQERAAERERLRRLGSDEALRIEYRIQPAATRPSRAFPLWRFSCAGFVLKAYSAARIELLGTPLPLKSVDDLKRLYPQHARLLDNLDVRNLLGIGEGDRWPVALVGYVLNSLAREAHEIHGEGATPYVPQPGDEFFPPQRIG